MNERKQTYIEYARQFDEQHGTKHAETITKLHHERLQRERENALSEIDNDDVEIVEYNDGKQRNVVGNYNDPNVLIKKCFNHLNSMKRAKTLSQQNIDNKLIQLHHENIEYRERDALELTLRTLQTIIKNQK